MNTQDELEAYIRQNRGIYTETAITEHLLHEGYSREDIERAFATFKQAAASGNPVASDSWLYEQPSTPHKWWDSTITGCLVFVVGFPLLVFAITFGISSVSLESRRVYEIFIPLPFVLILLLWLWALFASSSLIPDAPRFSRGIKYGARTIFVVFIVLPFVVAVVIAGICVVTGGRGFDI